MLKYFTFFTILFSSFSIHAQSVLNAELIRKIEYSTLHEKINVLVLTKANTKLDLSQFEDAKLHYQAGNIYAITASIKSIKSISKLSFINRIEYVEHHLQLMGDTCVVRNRIKDIKLGTPPLTQAYDGTGIIVGVMDSGTDFNHPDFKDASGNSRIKFLWDMTKPVSAKTPTAFGYGQEWNNTEIDLGQCTHDDNAHFGHGSNSSGIAAGNGLSINHYEGMAPKADLIVVALDFSRPGFTLSDAMQYMVDKSVILGKPLVVNASVGDYYGSHDGTDLESQVVNNLFANVPGRALVSACGNGGSTKFHVGYDVITDTNFTWIRNNSPQIDLTEYADTNQIKNVMYSVGVNNLGYNDLGRISFKAYNYPLNTLKRDTIYNGSNRIGIIESIASINLFGVYELYLSIKPDSANYFWRIEHIGNGRIDSWNFDYYTGTKPSSGLYPNIVNYKTADTLQTIVSGFQCSDEVIAVANYVNRNQFIDVNNNVQIRAETPGQIAGSSSVGPTRDGRIKPDITASGATILAATSLGILPNLITNAPQVVAQGGFHVTAGGTSASSPVVAGMVALYLQKHPTATNQQIRQAIINCAYNDVFTTTSLPNYKWGYGKLDGFASMTCGEVITNIKVSNESNIQVYPNPLINETRLLFNSKEYKKIKLYNASGQLIFTDECTTDTYILKRQNLPSGIYLLSCEEKNSTFKVKLLFL